MPGGGSFYINWETTGDTAADVPVTSQGPLSDRFNGINDNTFIYEVMLSAI
jgi:alkaline phosphatase